MPDDATDLYVRMKILEVLHDVQGYHMRENILFTQLIIGIEGVIDHVSLYVHLEYLRSKGLADFDIPEAGGPKRWKITESGKHAFREWQFNGGA